MDVATRKDSLRRLALARRRRLGPEERAARGMAIVEQVVSLPEFRAAGSVLVSVSMHSEVPTIPLIEQVLAASKSLLVPYVAEDGRLRASPIASLEELSPGYRGIPEPRARLPMEAGAAGLIVVPGVAFDALGARLGYGGGFFDGLLTEAADVTSVGLCFDVQLVDEVPTEEHDRPVDLVVTETRVVRVA